VVCPQLAREVDCVLAGTATNFQQALPTRQLNAKHIQNTLAILIA